MPCLSAFSARLLAAASFAAALAGVGAASASAARSCAGQGGRTAAENGIARLFVREVTTTKVESTTVLVCVRSGGAVKVRQLAKVENVAELQVDAGSLVGDRYASTWSRYAGPDYETATESLFDIRTGGRVVGVPSPAAFVASGAAIFLAAYDDPTSGERRDVRVVDVAGVRTVGSIPNGDDPQFAVAGQRVYWMQDGAPRSALLQGKVRRADANQ